MTYAVIDLGSSSFHLLIVSVDGRDLLRLNQKTNLAERLAETKRMSDQAQMRGMACLRDYSVHVKNHAVSQLLVVATEALRVAHNANDFLVQAEKQLAVPVRVLEGLEEARLIYCGAHRYSQPDRTDCVIDIGGASSEIAFGAGQCMDAAVSIPVGVVSIGERYFRDAIVNQHRYAQAKEALLLQVKQALSPVRHMQVVSALGTSGAIRCMAALGTHFGITIDTQVTRTHLNEIIAAWNGLPLASVQLDLPVHMNHLLLADIVLLEVIMCVLALHCIYPCITALGDGVLLEAGLISGCVS